MSFVLLICVGGLKLSAQVSDSIDRQEITAVTISSQPVLTEDINVTTISRRLIDVAPPVDLADLLNLIPGIHMQSGGYNTNKLTIRGVGARSQFATSAVKIFYNNIPLHSTIGESAIEDFGCSAMDRIEVITGNTGSSYEAGYGGAILMNNKNVKARNLTHLHSSLHLGPWGHMTNRSQMDLSRANQKRSHNLSIYHARTSDDGYRENNAYSRDNMTMTYTFNRRGKLKMSLLANHISIDASIPSSLSLEDFGERPSGAAFTWAAARGNEDYTRTLVGLDLDLDFDHKRSYSQTVYGRWFDGSELRPFNTIDETASTYGVKGRYQYLRSSYDEVYSLGYRVQRELYDFALFETEVDQKGVIFAEDGETRMTAELYGDIAAEVGDNFNYRLGWNLQHQHVSVRDTVVSSAWHLLPSIEMAYRAATHHRLYLRSGRGVQYYGAAEAVLPDGTYGTSIRPSTAWDISIGSKGRWLDQIDYRASLYWMWIADLLIPDRDMNNQPINTNAGSSIYRGIEIGADYRIIGSARKGESGVHLLLDATVSQNAFTEFEVDGMDLSGNAVPGTPTKTASATLIASIAGITMSTTGRYVSAFALRDDNSAFSSAYTLVHMTISYKLRLGSWIITPRLDGANLSDERYASMHLVNAASFGGNAPRYYYPGRPRHAQVSLTVDYEF